jgi:Family of unknown function (DUF6518)
MRIMTLQVRSDLYSAAQLRREDRLLKVSALIYLAGFMFHGTGHEINRTSAQTRWTGWVLLLAAVVVVVMLFRNHRQAPLLVLAVSALTALGLASVHIPPSWGPLSEPWRQGIEPVWWASLAVAIAGSVGAGAAAAYVLRRQSYRKSHAANLRPPTGEEDSMARYPFR